MFLPQGFQLCDELSDLGERESNKQLTTIILDDVPAEKYSTINVQAIRDQNSSLKNIMGIMKTIFINHSERSSIPKLSQESYRKGHDGGRDSTVRDRGRKVAMIPTCHN